MNTRELCRGTFFLAVLFGGTTVLGWDQDALTRTAMYALAFFLVLFLAYGEDRHEDFMRHAFRLRKTCTRHDADDTGCCLRHRAHYAPIAKQREKL